MIKIDSRICLLQGRLDREEVNEVLKFIQKSVGYHRGTSMLLDYTMQLSNFLVADTIPLDSALSIT